MTLHLHLLRHGETELGGGFRGRLDDALTEAGWSQMRASVGETCRWSALVSSPLRRCAAFAEELATRHGLPLSLDGDLRELDFGHWEGISPATLMESDAQALGRFWSDPYAFPPPGGEPLQAFEARVFNALERLYHAHAGTTVLVVTHGGVMRLLGALAGGLPARRLLEVAVAHGEYLSLEVTRDGEGWRIQPTERQ
ncbi:alpha-ribazole phosphatase family protein [Pseudomonas sp. ZM23]|uniref:Alpha-ribazole phosphatase family protein n=1 Tax=Pseudomonas triclosanedens TaxID=2961893 RepID=A0ABY7A2X8_9PSED|nr:alpha-ribazole phosphatase family protein [Pseudomonas triclosanedens]MCP8464265.1 alpha-ribazole phosphatase family protein [Pseudomonas triclosanedens]MCP8471399.1 alpha-ribazole phosphatase family protein [Pseudomonas triclosanedens]MCP8477792.1 alpha-ribazole phosphatase family protein [Pseudomonas triclosanedens]WAI51245.1 alpha-ribazole phosphatase family protein [Pseudomonas triclosanedens]